MQIAQKKTHPWGARLNAFLANQQQIIYPLLDIPLSALNYAFLVFASWYLTRIDYGIVNSLLALLAITLMIGLSVQTLTAKQVSALSTTPLSTTPLSATPLSTTVDATAIFQLGGLAGLLVGAIFVITMPILQAVTHGSVAALIALYLTFVCNIFLSIFRGIYQGQKRFLRLNLSFYIEVFGKTITLLLFLRWFPTITTVISAVLIGMALSLTYALIANWPARPSSPVAAQRQPIWPLLRQLSAIVAAQFLLQFLVTIDIILINYRSPYSAGSYAVVAKYGQLILFSFLSLQTVLFPILNRAATERSAFKSVLRSVTIGYLVLSLLLIVLYHTLIPRTIPLFFGAAYADAASLLTLGACVYCLLAFVHLLVTLFIVKGDASYLLCLAAAALMSMAMNIYYAQNLHAFLIAQIIVYAALGLALSWIGSVRWRT